MHEQKVSQTKSIDVFIAGGGMVGLTLCLMLAREMPTLNIVVADRASPDDQSDTSGHGYQSDSFDARSTALSSGTVELFQAIKVWPLLEDFATAIHSVDVSDKGHVGRNVFGKASQSQSVRGPLGYVVENKGIGDALLKSLGGLANVTVCHGVKVTGLTPKARGALIDVDVAGDTKAYSETYFAQLCVIADGTQSQLRARMGIETQVTHYKQHAVIANIEHENPHHGTAYERFTPEGPMAFLPRGHSAHARTSALVWTRPEAQVSSSLALDDGQFLAAIQERFGYRLGQLVKVGKRDHYPLKLVLAQEQMRSSLVVLGNAAHFLHPVAGQGFNLAARDCAQLVSVLSAANAADKNLGELSVLQRYIDKQQLDQASTVALSHYFNGLFSSASRINHAARNVGLLALQNLPTIQSQFFNRMMGRAATRPKLQFMRDYLAAAPMQASDPNRRRSAKGEYL